MAPSSALCRETVKKHLIFYSPPPQSNSSKGILLLYSIVEKPLLLQRNPHQVWMLCSALHALIKYPVHAYPVLSWEFPCSTVLHFAAISHSQLFHNQVRC